MKKIYLLLMMATMGWMLSAQVTGRFSFYKITHADTMTVLYSDKITWVNVSVSSAWTDSVTISGYAKTISGIPVSNVKVGPGESFTVGDRDIPIDYLRIIINKRARIILETKGYH